MGTLRYSNAAESAFEVFSYPGSTNVGGKPDTAPIRSIGRYRNSSATRGDRNAFAIAGIWMIFLLVLAVVHFASAS